jgi:hypothetical protein
LINIQGAFCRKEPLDSKVRRFFVCISEKFGRNGGIRAKLDAFIRLLEFESPLVVMGDILLDLLPLLRPSGMEVFSTM